MRRLTWRRVKQSSQLDGEKQFRGLMRRSEDYLQQFLAAFRDDSANGVYADPVSALLFVAFLTLGGMDYVAKYLLHNLKVVTLKH